MRTNIDNWRIPLLISFLLFFCLYSLLGLWRHWAYLTSINDLGCFDQVVWMASRGNSLVNTSNFGMPVNWLGYHFQPILFVFVLLYKITPSVNWFILIQGAALAISVWPVFLVAERVTASAKVAFIWSLAYLFNPFMLNTAAWDFHPVSIAVPFLALGLLAIERKQVILLLFVSMILLACKEQMGLTVAGLGLLYGIRNRSWATGLGFSLAGIAVFILVVSVVMPDFSITDQHPMFGENIELGRYSWLGGSPAEAIKKIIMDPLFVVRTVFIDQDGINYVVTLLEPFLYLPVLALPWIFPAIGDLSINLLSSVPLPRSVFSYHTVTLIPVLIVAAVHGAQKLSHAARWFSADKIAVFVLLMSLFLGYVRAPLPFPGSINPWSTHHTIIHYDKKVVTARKLVGNASASVQANIGAHFSQRESIYRYPGKVGEVDFIVLRLENPSKWKPTLPHLLLMDPGEYLDSVLELLSSGKYGVVLWDDPWLILQRDHESDEYTRDVLIKIEKLREEWSVNPEEIAGQRK